ncbi:MAG: hypothetical protein L0Y44_04970 [Phycisphaerales bacterium]|nr:hypothetical protein [Phycisphaerales bacterium]MCI0629989.1 hypothetical protein [Phycisphaerales bacterium]MCI0677095.1 hypothetical protein [Phycisphaerales bacterium]
MAKTTRKSSRSGGARSAAKKKSSRKSPSARKKSRSPRASSKAVKALPKLKPASLHGPSATLSSGSIAPLGSIPSHDYSKPSFGSSPSPDYRPISRPSSSPTPSYNPVRSNELSDPFGTATSTNLEDDDEVDDVDDNDDDEESGMNRPLLLG